MAIISDAQQASALGSSLQLAGRSVLVTGAGSGIGEAVALGLGQLGMKVLGVARRTDALQRVADRARELDVTFEFCAADVTDEQQMDKAVATATDIFGGLDSAVANAGTAVVEPAMTVAVEDFRTVVDTNLNGVFITARSAAKQMKPGSSIVFTSSSFARRGFADWSSYNASKAAVSMLAETLAVEWAKRGIRVNAIGPTATLTAVNEAQFADEDFTAAVVAGIPAGRILQAPELVLPTAFLLSPLNEMILGQTLMVDGGQTL